MVSIMLWLKEGRGFIRSIGAGFGRGEGGV